MNKLMTMFAALIAAQLLNAEAIKTPETSKLFVKYTDPNTGVISYILKPGVYSENQQSFYFTQKSMTDDGRFLLFWNSNNEFIKGPNGKKRPDCRGTALIDFAKDEIIDLGISHQIPFIDVKTDQVWYFTDERIDNKPVRNLCRRDLKVDPLKVIVECPVPDVIWKKAKKLYYLSTHPTMTRNRRKMFIAYHADDRYEQGMINLDTGDFESWGTTEFFANHDQLNPVRDDLAMVAWERCSSTADAKAFRERTGIYPRMWLVYPDGRRELQPSKVPTRNYATHEHWSEDGKGFYWCASGVCYQNLETGEQELACPWPASHAAISADNRFVCYDNPIDKWYRGCKWRVGLWDRTLKRGVFIHSNRPALCPEDSGWHNHPDPHPQFVCNDRYVVSTINNADGHMDLSVTPVEPLKQRLAQAIEFPLEWSTTYDTKVPIEVEISPRKIEKLAGVVNPAFQVVATRSESGNLFVPVTTIMRGQAPDSVVLRFKLPSGISKLSCIATPSESPITPIEYENFGSALTSKKHWSLPKDMEFKQTESGVILRAPKNSGWAKLTAAVPEGWAGQPVKLEMTCRSLTKMVWGGVIRLTQFDKEGKELPENVVDPRWTSHMRPYNKSITYREFGRIHPSAAKISVEIELRHESSISIDAYGLPLTDKSCLIPELEITRLSLRPAMALPFPKYRDELFQPGVSETTDDTALALGGERAFWFATRSQASWSGNKLLRDEKEVFFPSGAGTMEAWFKADKLPKSGTQWFMQNAHFSSKVEKGSRYNETRGTLYGVSYDVKEGKLVFQLKDAAEKVFKTSAKVTLPVDEWFHLAAVWTPGGEAAVYLNGKKSLSMPIKEYVPYDLKTLRMPNDTPGVEFHLGSDSNARTRAVREESDNYFSGLVDSLRISTGARYSADFTPAKKFKLDSKTRALFNFDRSFDGRSGAGIGWISGTFRDLTDRVDHQLALADGRKVWYWAKDILPENNPDVVLNKLNYPELPTAEEFVAARRTMRKSATMKAGDVLKFAVDSKAYPDYVEFVNDTTSVLKFPALVNKGEIDPRSFGDISDSLGTSNLSDREKANAVFNFVLGASDYFMNHQPIFAPGSDCPQSVEYKALVMLNAYCGFECGPLNNLAANMFACAGGCPAGQTAGYGHSFEQVFYDGKNHIYDLSAQRFFPAMDNETAAYLEEDAQQPGMHNRLGASASHFIRKSLRHTYVQTPAFQPKVAMTLNPGETFRVWFANNGSCNDLQYNSCFCGNRRESPSANIKPENLTPYQENYEQQCHAKCKKNLKNRPDDDLNRIDRFFPHYGNGFLTFEGAPDMANPAFLDGKDGTFSYCVNSCYPVVAAEYAALRKDGSAVPLEITTDFKEMRPLTLKDGVAKLEYEVKARVAYRIRVKASPADVARFSARTVVMVNSRIYPGKVRKGENELLFKAHEGGVAKVTVQWRENVKSIEFKGALANGTIPGYERQTILLDPDKGAADVEVVGASSTAVAVATDGLSAKLNGGRLSISATRNEFVGFVTVRDGDAEKELTVIVCRNARLVPIGTTLAKKGKSSGRFEYEKLPAGEYSLWTLERWESRPANWMGRQLSARFDTKNKEWITVGGPCNSGLMFYKARYGQEGGRAAWRWDHAIDPNSYYPYPLIRRFNLSESSSIEYSLTSDIPNGVEVAAALIMPFPSQDFKCQLKKVLGGLNCVPSRVK